jgi:hypothetical protein
VGIERFGAEWLHLRPHYLYSTAYSIPSSGVVLGGPAVCPSRPCKIGAVSPQSRLLQLVRALQVDAWLV